MTKMDVLQRELEERRARHLYRHRRVVESPQGVRLRIGGRAYLNFCSNDYLGLAGDARVVEAMCRGARQFGAGSGAAHLVNGHMTAHHALEEELADFVRRPRALLFSTGYMANVGVISALCQRGDSIYQDRLNHASLLDGALLSRARLQRFAHRDAADLENKLAASRGAVRLVASDGVFSMDGDSASLTDLSRVCKQYDAWLMIDDAHGLGVMGESGRGTLEAQGIGNAEVPVLVGTLGKAFGTFGAFVAGEPALIETLIQKARSYVYTTALPPAVAEATRTSLRIVSEEPLRRSRLHENVAYFRQAASQLGLATGAESTPIQPLIIGDSEAALALSEGLERRGILVSAIRPPTVPAGGARLRITLSAAHTHEDIDQLLDALQQSLNA